MQNVEKIRLRMSSAGVASGNRIDAKPLQSLNYQMVVGLCGLCDVTRQLETPMVKA